MAGTVLVLGDGVGALGDGVLGESLDVVPQDLAMALGSSLYTDTTVASVVTTDADGGVGGSLDVVPQDLAMTLAPPCTPTPPWRPW